MDGRKARKSGRQMRSPCPFSTKIATPASMGRTKLLKTNLIDSEDLRLADPKKANFLICRRFPDTDALTHVCLAVRVPASSCVRGNKAWRAFPVEYRNHKREEKFL